jgi:hypothetical protein
MNPFALQFASIDITRFDNATLLSYMHRVDDHGLANETMRTKMGQWWTDFHAAYLYYDEVINPSRKSLETEDLANLDNVRDDALGAYHVALLGLQRNPNDSKRQAARLLLLNFDTFKPSAGQEYMKETELIEQMTKEIDDSQELTAAVALLGLGDYLDDLKQKNQAFATMMASRTASTEGQVKGAVTSARADLEAKYQLFRRLLNVASTYEGDTDYRPFLLSVNAEVEHYKQILSRKGVSSGGSSNGGGDNGGDNGGSDDNGGDNGGGDDNGGDTPVNPDNPDTPDNPDNPGGGDNGGGDNGGGTTPPGGNTEPDDN